MKIALYYKYLKADINQWTYRLAHAIENDAVRAEAEADEVQTDKEFYRREIETAVALMSVLIQSKLKKQSESADDILDLDKKSWMFDIDDDEHDAKAVAELMHKFIITQVVCAWAKAYMPTSYSTLLGEASAATEALNEGLYSITLPIKHRRPSYQMCSTVTIEE